MYYYTGKYPGIAKSVITNAKAYTFFKVVGVILFEADKLNKLKAVARGLIDSRSMLREVKKEKRKETDDIRRRVKTMDQKHRRTVGNHE